MKLEEVDKPKPILRLAGREREGVGVCGWWVGSVCVRVLACACGCVGVGACVHACMHDCVCVCACVRVSWFPYVCLRVCGLLHVQHIQICAARALSFSHVRARPLSPCLSLSRCPFPNHPEPLADTVERSLSRSLSATTLSLSLSPLSHTATRRLWETQRLTLSLSPHTLRSLSTHKLHRADTGEANGSMHSTAENCKTDFDLSKVPEPHDHESILVDFTMAPGVFMCLCVRARTCPCIRAQVHTYGVSRGGVGAVWCNFHVCVPLCVRRCVACVRGGG